MVKFKKWICKPVLVEYQNGGPGIHLVGTGEGGTFPGEPIATATVWADGLSADEVAVKNYAENEGMLGALLSAGLVQPPHMHIPSGFVQLPVCYLNREKFV